VNCWAVALGVKEVLAKIQWGLVREQLQAAECYFYVIGFTACGVA